MNNHQINKINKKWNNSGKYYIQTLYQLNSIHNTPLTNSNLPKLAGLCLTFTFP